MSEDIVRLLDHLDIKKAHVIGYSFGSEVAGKLLVTHPDRLLSMTFGGGGPRLMDSKMKWFEKVHDATAQSLDQEKGLGPLILGLNPEGQPKPDSEQITAINRQLLENQDQKALAAVLHADKGLKVSKEELNRNKVPVLFIYGSGNNFSKERVEEDQKLNPNATIRVIQGGNHLNTPVRPDFLIDIQEFLDTHEK